MYNTLHIVHVRTIVPYLIERSYMFLCKRNLNTCIYKIMTVYDVHVRNKYITRGPFISFETVHRQPIIF